MATSLLQYVTQRLGFVIRSNPTLVGKHPGGIGVDPNTNVYLAYNGGVTASQVVRPANVAGRYYHAVHVLDLDGTDSWKIEGSLSYLDEGWQTVTGLGTLAANGISQFTGVYRQLRATKNSGTGVATKIILMAMR